MVRWGLLAAGLAAAGWLGGCSAEPVLRDARAYLARAEAAGAESAAPYEYYAAEVYLEMAEEESREFDVEAARMFGRESIRFGGLARVMAEEGQ